MNKQFVVIGCGRFGRSVATQLCELGCEVMVVDQDYEIIQDVSDHVTFAVQADATDEATIANLGIRNFDVAVVAIGSDIQSSILVTIMVKEMGVKYVVAKAQTETHGKVLYRVGADRVVFPEREMGMRVANNLVADNILDYIQLANDYSIVEILANDEWVGKTLGDLNLRKRYGINVMAIKHFDQINASVQAEDVVREGDVLVVIGSNKDINRVSV